jgi:hypothetical protein
MVSEDAAAALVVREAVALKLEGYDPVITAANERRLMWYAALLLDGFGITARETEVRDEALHQDPG